jgi:hypothetical protein
MLSRLLLFAALLCRLARAQFGEHDPPKKPKPAPMNEDLPYIACGVCTHLVTEMLRQSQEMAKGEVPTVEKKRRFDFSHERGALQASIEDVISRICDADQDGLEGRGKQGLWMSELDISKDGRQLVLENKGSGFCRRECRTIAKSCERVREKLEDADDDLAETLLAAIRSKQPAPELAQRVCTTMAGVCKKKGKGKLWPEGKPRMNEQFKHRNSKWNELEEFLGSMKGTMGEDMKLNVLRPGEMSIDGDEVDELDVLKEEL